MSPTNSNTGEWPQLRGDVEQAAGEISPAFDIAVDNLTQTLRIGPDDTVADIARICAWFSTPEREVFARIECVDGKPVGYFVRGESRDFLPAFLRRQAG